MRCIPISVPLAFAALSACNSPVVAPDRCPADDQAPVRDGNGGFACIRVGASATAATTDWPDATGATAPVFVQAGAPAGGTGASMSSPLADLAAAVAALPATGGTLVLARGSYALGGTLVLRGAVTVLGAGAAMGTTLAPAHGVAAFIVETGATVRASGLRVSYTSATSDALDTGFSVHTGATLDLRDVAIDNANRGVLVDGATLTADGLTVRGAVVVGVGVTSGGVATLRRLLVRDGAGAGVIAIGSHVHVTQALLAQLHSYGLALSGDPPAGTGAAACAADGPGTTSGELDCISQVTITCSSISGIYASGARTLEVRRVAVTDTLAGAGATPVGGDGLYLGASARAHFDPDMCSAGDARRGFGSMFVGNARAGVLADGTATQPSELALCATSVSSNQGPGLFGQNRAVVSAVAYARVDDNTAVGIGATLGAGVASITCSSISGTRAGSVPIGMDFSTADGIALLQGTVRITNSVLSNNARYAARFEGVSGQLTGNTGTNNRFGLRVDNSPMLVVDAPAAIGGREAPPAAPPPTLGALSGVSP